MLQYLVELGATANDLVAYRDELPGLASVVAIRQGTALTFDEILRRSGIAREKLRRFNRAAGFADPAPDDRTFSESFVNLASGMEAAEKVFGEDAVLQLLRVMGSAMARVADACVSAFLVNVESTIVDEDPGRLGVARANAEAAALLPFVGTALDALLRQHLIGARRTILGDIADAGYETQHLLVGFVDLVSSTALAQRLSTRELGAALTEFENLAADAVTAEGGRVVKLIGDEILYTAGDERSGCRIAFKLAATFADHSVIPPVRDRDGGRRGAAPRRGRLRAGSQPCRPGGEPRGSRRDRDDAGRGGGCRSPIRAARRKAPEGLRRGRGGVSIDCRRWLDAAWAESA